MASKMWYSKNILLLWLVLQGVHGHGEYKYENWKFHFLPGSAMGLFLALAIPIDLPNKSVYLAYNFEANYALPDNTTSLEYPPLIERSVDRQLVYSALETKLHTSGYPGKACLLRTICEASQLKMDHANGILGDILHIIFTPSSTKNTDLPGEYNEAEMAGSNNNCTSYHKKCTVSFLDTITWFEKANLL